MIKVRFYEFRLLHIMILFSWEIVFCVFSFVCHHDESSPIYMYNISGIIYRKKKKKKKNPSPQLSYFVAQLNLNLISPYYDRHWT